MSDFISSNSYYAIQGLLIEANKRSMEANKLVEMAKSYLPKRENEDYWALNDLAYNPDGDHVVEELEDVLKSDDIMFVR